MVVVEECEVVKWSGGDSGGWVGVDGGDCGGSGNDTGHGGK